MTDCEPEVEQPEQPDPSGGGEGVAYNATIKVEENN